MGGNSSRLPGLLTRMEKGRRRALKRESISCCVRASMVPPLPPSCRLGRGGGAAGGPCGSFAACTGGERCACGCLGAATGVGVGASVGGGGAGVFGAGPVPVSALWRLRATRGRAPASGWGFCTAWQARPRGRDLEAHCWTTTPPPALCSSELDSDLPRTRILGLREEGLPWRSEFELDLLSRVFGFPPLPFFFSTGRSLTSTIWMASPRLPDSSIRFRWSVCHWLSRMPLILLAGIEPIHSLLNDSSIKREESVVPSAMWLM
mmetsp:Transcript_8205/g.34458  ORF Transcript_8205/g.34458 Transcript_8205/m.34458 type:complete len:263 (-) Transcript_8205:1033-1821(-)